MSYSPTQLSLKYMREQGYLVQVVEYWQPFARIRRDLWGFDILCVGEGETVAVQCTSYSNLSARINKIGDLESTPKLRKAGWKLLCHGWHKVKNRYQVREVDVS